MSHFSISPQQNDVLYSNWKHVHHEVPVVSRCWRQSALWRPDVMQRALVRRQWSLWRNCVTASDVRTRLQEISTEPWWDFLAVHSHVCYCVARLLLFMLSWRQTCSVWHPQVSVPTHFCSWRHHNRVTTSHISAGFVWNLRPQSHQSTFIHL